MNLNLFDVVFSIATVGTGLDDGDQTLGSPSYSTVCVNSVRVRHERQTADHSCGQSLVASERTTKVSWEVEVEMGLAVGDSFLATLKAYPKVAFRASAANGVDITCPIGLVDRVEVNYDSPSTITFTIKNYGVDLTIVGA